MPFVGLCCGGTSAAELRGNHAVEVWRDPPEMLTRFDSSTVSGVDR